MFEQYNIIIIFTVFEWPYSYSIIASSFLHTVEEFTF